MPREVLHFGPRDNCVLPVDPQSLDLNLEFKSNAISKSVGLNGMTLNPRDCKAFTACITALRQPGVGSKIPS